MQSRALVGPAVWFLVAGAFLPAQAQESPPQAPPAAAQPAAPPAAKPPAPPEPGTPGSVEGEAVVLDRGLKLFQKDRRIEADGVVCLQKGLLELYACGEGGKDHESILVFPFRAQQLQLGLILLGLRDKHEQGGGGPRFQGDPTRPVGDRVHLSIEWTGPDGRKETRRAEDFVVDAKTGATAPHVGWVFAGSEFGEERDPGTGEPTGRKIYLANRYKVIIAIQHDPTAVLDFPLDAGQNWAAARFFCNENAIPAVGTRIKLVLRPPSEDEAREMERIEKVESAAKDDPPKPVDPPKKEEGKPAEGAGASGS
ncbi:MAG: hypothetical protein HYZ53_00060 [Planctomycetes bacterium]|nr:hypothetical protein [Planctomycetota bacterium]